MFEHRRHSGFSLTEVLLAVGTLAIGMVFVAGVFPAAIHFTTIATERTIAAVAVDEAFAKIRIYAIGDMDNNPSNDDIDFNELREDGLTDFNDINEPFPAIKNAIYNEFVYPSTGDSEKQYYWSALCRLTEVYDAVSNPNPPVQVIVFVSRKTGAGLKYPAPPGVIGDVNWPMPVKVKVNGVGGKNNELVIESGKETYINDGYTIVDDRTGRIYRVLERYVDDPDTPEREDVRILLDRDWDDRPPGSDPEAVWVVPPPLAPDTGSGQRQCSGRNPCIAIYQKVIRF
jgi:type II secretory pathway pseudopilin PulG